MYLPQHFERNVSASPYALAITCEGQRITYRDLNRSAEQIADGLREAGVRDGCLVGVLLDRFPESALERTQMRCNELTLQAAEPLNRTSPRTFGLGALGGQR